MESTLGILFGILSLLGYGISAGIAKVPLQKYGSIKMIFYRGVVVMIALLCLLGWKWNSLIFNWTYILVALGIGLAGFFPLFFFYKAISVGKLGVVAPIANSASVITISLAIILLGETLSLSQGISIGLILLGIIISSLNLKDLKNSDLLSPSSGIPYALLAWLLWGIVYFFMDFPVSIIGPILSAFLIELGGLLCATIFLLKKRESVMVTDKKTLGVLILVGLFGAMGTLFFNLGVSIAEVSIVVTLTFANPIATSIYGAIAYKERLTSQQYVAFALMILGVVGISLL